MDSPSDLGCSSYAASSHDGLTSAIVSDEQDTGSSPSLA